jgi:two-component system sensor histidine kinase UhpB
MSLRLKTNLFFSVLLIASLLTTMGILVSNARQSVHIKVESAMKTAEHLVTVAMPASHSRNSPSAHQRMAKLVETLSELRGIHMMVYRSGQLLYAGGGETASDQSKPPPELFIKLLTPTIKPLIKKSAGGAIVIYAAPEQEIRERWADIRVLLTLGSGLSFLIILLLYVGINRILKPLEFLSGALLGFEKGDFHLRLPKFSLNEMDHISDAFNRMGEALQSSIEENQRLATLVKQSRDAIFSLDHNGNIIFYNQMAESLFTGLCPESLGSSLLNLNFEKHQKKIREVIEHDETLVNLEILLSREGQTDIDLLLSMSPLSNINENASGFICTIRDVTQHKEAEAAERQLHESRLLTQHISNVQENERRSLARELHDELGQCLTAIKTDAVLIRNRSHKRDTKISDSAQAIIDVASHIYDVVHHMLSRLRPTPLDDLGLILTLQGAISTWQKRQPNIHFELNIKGPLDNLSETMNMTVYRIIQESITNAVRHAKASLIVITIHNANDNGQLIMNIADDGKGMVIKDFYSDVDFGILGMRERIQSMDGKFKLVSNPGEGVNIQVSIPIQAKNI